MAERSLTMGAEELVPLYRKAFLDAEHFDKMAHQSALHAVAREAERRLLARLRALDLESLLEMREYDFGIYDAEHLRSDMLAAVEEGDQ